MAYKFNPLLGAGLDDAGPSISALNVLGTVANEAALPGSATAGDVYQAEDTGVFYVWDGTGWDNLGTLAGPQGPTGATGPAGADGVGVIAGGTTGQALVKASNTDYDTQWADVTAVAALDDLTDVNLTSPSDGQVLEYDSATSTWVNATPSGGGGGTPGGSDTQVQFNDGGSFGGDSGLTFNKTTNALTVGASTGDGGSAKVYGDINLDDGGTHTTTLQMVTATANRTISFPDATGTVALVAGSNQAVQFNSAGALSGDSGLLYDATTGALTVGGKTVTADAPVINLSQTWNNAGVTFTGLKLDVTNTASAGGSNLLDLQVGGVSRGRFNASGTYISSYNATTDWVAGVVAFGQRYGLATIQTGTALLNFSSGGTANIGGTDPGYSISGDVKLTRDAANTLAQRNGTNAQTYRLYNTYTDASNYERGFLRWSSNVFEIGSEGAGTGSEKPVRITAATLKLPNLPTYADNAAATSGGLVAGDVYKTATGELRITV